MSWGVFVIWWEIGFDRRWGFFGGDGDVEGVADLVWFFCRLWLMLVLVLGLFLVLALDFLGVEA